MDSVVQEIFTNSKYADVIIRVIHSTVTKDFYANKAFLAANSKPWETMLYDGFLESSQEGKSVVELTDIDPQTMELFLHYCYLRKLPNIEITLQELRNLLSMADKYLMDHLITYVDKHLERKVKCEYSVVFLEEVCAILDTFPLPNFQKRVTEYILENLSIETEEKWWIMLQLYRFATLHQNTLETLRKSILQFLLFNAHLLLSNHSLLGMLDCSYKDLIIELAKSKEIPMKEIDIFHSLEVYYKKAFGRKLNEENKQVEEEKKENQLNQDIIQFLDILDFTLLTQKDLQQIAESGLVNYKYLFQRLNDVLAEPNLISRELRAITIPAIEIKFENQIIEKFPIMFEESIINLSVDTPQQIKIEKIKIFHDDNNYLFSLTHSRYFGYKATQVRRISVENTSIKLTQIECNESYPFTISIQADPNCSKRLHVISMIHFFYSPIIIID